MKTKFWILTMAAGMMLALSACSSSDGAGEEPALKPGDEVTNFQPAVSYDQTNQFQNDMDALCTYALNLQALRLACWNMMSFDFDDPEKAFTATPEQMMENTKQVERFYEIVNHMAENSDTYMEALETLDAAGIIPLQRGTVTRGFPLADAWAFEKACKNTMFLGRKSVMIALDKGGFLNDAAKMNELYHAIPEGNRRGYDNAADFWKDFAEGKLDERSNTIFNNLYKLEYTEFGHVCDDIGVTPQTNMAVAAARLIETGSSLVIDALPIGSAINKGKDLFSTIDATVEFHGKLLTGNLDRETTDKYLQTCLNNALNYGRDLKKYTDQMNGKNINYSELYEGLLDFGKEIGLYTTSEYLFGNSLKDYIDKLDTSGLETKVKIVYSETGDPLSVVVMVDKETGETKLSMFTDDQGHILISPGSFGTKTVTVVNRNTGQRTTKEVVVKEGDPAIKVEFDEVMLDENPKDGYIKLANPELGDEGSGGSYKTLILTNYLYYTCQTDEKWLSASIARDANILYVKAAKNDTGQERKGKVTVSATDSKGKVLKSTVLTFTQTLPVPTENWVNATPSSLLFNGEGGVLETIIDSSNAFNHLGVDWSDELTGWITIDWKETATGHNLVVTANPNDTGIERSGTITVFAGTSAEAVQAAMNGRVDPENATSTTILVKQDPRQMSSNIARISVQALFTYSNGEAGGAGGSVTEEEGQISATVRGNALHIEGSSTTNPPGNVVDVMHQSISIDIDDINLIAANKATITNVEVTQKTESTYQDITSTTNTYLRLSMIPMADDYYSFKHWKGDNDCIVDYYTDAVTYYSDRTEESHLTFIDSPSNTVEVWIEFKDGSSTRFVAKS